MVLEWAHPPQEIKRRKSIYGQKDVPLWLPWQRFQDMPIADSTERDMKNDD